MAHERHNQSSFVLEPSNLSHTSEPSKRHKSTLLTRVMSVADYDVDEEDFPITSTNASASASAAAAAAASVEVAK